MDEKVKRIEDFDGYGFDSRFANQISEIMFFSIPMIFSVSIISDHGKGG
jgi:hypothetical protein